MKSAQESRPRNPQSRHPIEPSSTPIVLVEVAPRRSPGAGALAESEGGDTGARSRAHLQPLAKDSRRRPWRTSPATFPQFCDPRARSREGRSSPASRSAGCLSDVRGLRSPRAKSARGGRVGWPGEAVSLQATALRCGRAPSRVGSWVLGRRSGLVLRETNGRQLCRLSPVGGPPPTLALTRSSCRMFLFPGQSVRESDQAWRPRSAVLPSAGAGPLRPEGRRARVAATSVPPGPAHTLVEPECLRLSVAAGPFFCSFEAYSAPIPAEAPLCARETRRRTVLTPRFGGSYSDFFSPKSPPGSEEALDPAAVLRDWGRQCLLGLQRRPSSPGASRRRKRLWPGAAAALQRLRKRGCSARPGRASCNPVPAGSSAAGGELPPGAQSASRPHLAGLARPLEAMASAPLPGSPARGWPVPFGFPNKQGNLPSPPREHASVGAPFAARPSSREGGGEEGDVQADL